MLTLALILMVNGVERDQSCQLGIGLWESNCRWVTTNLLLNVFPLLALLGEDFDVEGPIPPPVLISHEY